MLLAEFDANFHHIAIAALAFGWVSVFIMLEEHSMRFRIGFAVLHLCMVSLACTATSLFSFLLLVGDRSHSSPNGILRSSSPL